MEAPKEIYLDRDLLINHDAIQPVGIPFPGDVKYVRAGTSGLDWEDVKEIVCTFYSYMNDIAKGRVNPGKTEVGLYSEVLRRINQKRAKK